MPYLRQLSGMEIVQGEWIGVHYLQLAGVCGGREELPVLLELMVKCC